MSVGKPSSPEMADERDSPSLVTSPFTEAERRLHFRCYKTALRIADAMALGDKDSATAELEALVALVTEPSEARARG